MRFAIRGAALGLTAWAGLAAALAADAPARPEATGKCSTHGTTVEFFDTPAQAAAKATHEQKLVLVLHVSGLFEDPNLT